MLWLLIAINQSQSQQTSLDYFKEQDSLYPNFEKVVNHTQLNSYLADPDTFNLQMLYGWGRDLGKKNPEIGFWIADTLLSLAKSKIDHRAIISAYSLQAQMHHQKSEYYKSIKSYKLAINYSKENLDYQHHPNFDKLGINYVYLGDLFYLMKETNKAKIYYEKGWDILSKITTEMILTQDSINAGYPRDYTTYQWDQLYSKLQLGKIYLENSSTKFKGAAILKEVFKKEFARDALIKIESAFALGKAFIHDSEYYLDTSYIMAKYAKLYNLQAEIGLDKINQKTKDLDINLVFEVLNASETLGNARIKYQAHKILSDYYYDLDIKKSKYHLDSAYYYKSVFFDEENQKKIGKIQSDLEYQSEIKIYKKNQEMAKYQTRIAIIVASLLLVILFIITYLIFQRKKLLKELRERNYTISNQNIRLSELIQSREKLIGILGNDLRNPIKGFKLLATDLINQSEYQMAESLKNLENSAGEIENLLNSILDYAESNLNIPDEFEDINLDKIIESGLSLNSKLINKKALSFELDLKVVNVNSSKFVLTNILNNLITNAARFSFENKTVRISTYTEDSFNIIKIQDEGIGIEVEDLEKIRKQIKPKIQQPIKSNIGNGFGLISSISQLEKINGNFFIESEVGSGTTILIYLNS